MFSFSLGVCPGVELLDHMVVLFSVFQGPSMLLSTVAVPVYIPTNSVHFSPHLCQHLSLVLFLMIVILTDMR